MSTHDAPPHATSLNLPLASLPMGALLSAQFLSALADNALLIAAIAIVKSRGLPGLVPALQECFVVPFILLAPFVGAIADAWPKGRVMLVSNSVKLVGAALMMSGLHPLAAYALVGVGAAAYSPAKYGILAQMFDPAKLVQANGMLEGSTIAAILLGVVAGGLLADSSLDMAFIVILGCYGVAAGANLLIPRLPPEKPLDGVKPVALLMSFGRELTALFRISDARFSLLGTSIFWGSGTTLRLMLFAWVPVALGYTDNQTPANLMGAVSVGIVAGAAAAGALIRIENANRALVAGLLLGPLVGSMALIGSMPAAIAALVGIGACGGLFVVPLNALLQERGHETVGAGRALAVQNFCENLMMLGFVGLYGVAVARGFTPNALAAGFGALLLAGIGALALTRLRTPAQSTQNH